MMSDWQQQMNAAALKLLQRRDAEKRAQAANKCVEEWAEDDSDAVAQEFAERLQRKDVE